MKLLYKLLLLPLFVHIFLTFTPPAYATTTPLINGTFIQLWNSPEDGGTWTKEQWDQHLLRLKNNCQNTIIIQFSTHANAAWYHPSNLSWISHTSQAMQHIFTAAEKYHMNIVIGLAHGTGEWDWVNDMNDSSHYSPILTKHKQVAQEVYNLFGTSPAFAGWYIPQELDWIRFPHNSSAQAHAAQLFQDTANYVKSLANKPVYIAPYFQSMEPQQAEAWWDRFLNTANNIDVILAQDGAGRENANLEKFFQTYSAIGRSARKANIGFGIDIETFAQNESRSPSWSRVSSQLQYANQVNPDIIVQFEYRFMNPDLGHEPASLFNDYKQYQNNIATCSYNPSSLDPYSPFIDIHPSSLYYHHILNLFQKNIIAGTSHFKFSPKSLITRAQAAVILSHTFKLDINSHSNPSINDVSPSHWAYPYIATLLEHNISSGCSTNPLKYCPDDPLTNAQLAVMLIKAWQIKDSSLALANPSTPTYSDLSSSHWAYSYVETLAQKDVTWHCNDNHTKFCPDQPLTRTQTTLPLSLILDQLDSTTPIPGDLNHDGTVNIFDYNLLVAGFGTKYDIFDYNQLIVNYGK